MIHRIASIAAAFCLAATPAPAQQPAGVKVSFDVLFWADWPEQNLRYLSGKKEMMIPLQNGLSGGMYHYEGPAKAVFYRDKTPDPATGAALPVPLASVSFPKPSGHYILLFRNVDESKEHYVVFPIPVNRSTFPTNSVLAINFSKSEAQLQVQGLRGSLTPRASRFFEVKPGDFSVQMATLQEQQWQLAYSSMHAMQDKQRLLVVVHNTPAGDTSVAAFDVQDPASADQSLVDPDYKPDEMPEWRRTGVFR